MPHIVTIREVAREAGVHHSVAGAVLNGARGNTRVGETTRERVEAVALRLGYQANEAAQSLRRGTSANVCLVGGDLRNPFFAELAAKFERELLGNDLRLLITHVARSNESRADMIISLLRRQSIRTVIYWEESGSPHALPFCSEETARGKARSEESDRVLPIGYSTSPRPGIWLDLVHGMQLAVHALSSAGKRRLGFYYPDSDDESPSVSVRRSAFLDVCRQMGLPEPQTVTFPGDSCNLAGAAGHAHPTLQAHPEVEGWLGFNDVASMGLLMARPHLPRPPEVFCFDGTEVTRNWPGSPPALDLRLDELVARCVRLVTGADDKPDSVTLQPRLKERHESTHWIATGTVRRIPTTT